MSFFHVYSVKIFDHDMTLFFRHHWGFKWSKNTGLKFVVDCTNGVANNFSCFKGKNFWEHWQFFWNLLHTQDITNFLKNDYLLFWEIPVKLIRSCTNGVANKFQGVLGRFEGKKKIFWRLPVFLTFFAYPGSQISWKMTNFFFERYRPEICRGLHKWCCEQILRHLGCFERKKFFFKNLKFFDFFCISGVTDFLKNDQLLFWEIPAWNLSWTAQMVLRTNFKAFRLFRAKKIFLKIGNFLTFFAYPGSQISWKMTNFFFERYRPEICCGLHKWCCEKKRILRLFLPRLFRAKKISFRAKKKIGDFLTFLHIRGHRFLEKWLTTFLRDTGLKFVVDCTNGVANEF